HNGSEQEHNDEQYRTQQPHPNRKRKVCIFGEWNEVEDENESPSLEHNRAEHEREGYPSVGSPHITISDADSETPKKRAHTGTESSHDVLTHRLSLDRFV